MYPNLYYFLYKAFGIQQPWGWTRYVNTFGFFVALSFIAAAIVLTAELKRMERAGWLFPREENHIVGKPATAMELLLNGLFGFLIGYKIVGIFFSPGDLSPQEFIFSTQGNWLAGIALGLGFAGMKFYEKNKQKLDQPGSEFSLACMAACGGRPAATNSTIIVSAGTRPAVMVSEWSMPGTMCISAPR